MPRLNQRRRTTSMFTTTPITSTVLVPVPEVHRISPSNSIGSDMCDGSSSSCTPDFPDVTKLDFECEPTATVPSAAGLSDSLSSFCGPTQTVSRKSGLVRIKSMKHGLSDLASIGSSDTTSPPVTKRRLDSMYLNKSDTRTDQDDEQVDATWGHFVEHNNISRVNARVTARASSPYFIKARFVVKRSCTTMFQSDHPSKASTAVDEFFHALAL